MRIAISGAHRTGKTTLVEVLVGLRPEFTAIDEPYHQLAAEGHAFDDPPSLADFVVQLERSLRSLAEHEGDVLFDRCPADFLAYLMAHPEAEAFDPGPWLPDVRRAMERLDLVVFVPIEEPDRVDPGAIDLPKLRRRVHGLLEDIVLDDAMGFGVPALEVTGTPEERARRVLERIGGIAGRDAR